MISFGTSFQENRTTTCPTASKKTKKKRNPSIKSIKKWITLRVSLCSECGYNCLGTAFVHEINPDTGEMGEDEVGDYYCTQPECACRGKFMGHYARYCRKCKRTEEVPDEEVEDI